MVRAFVASALTFFVALPAQAEWQTVCENNRCELFQRLYLQDGKTVVSQMVFSRYEAEKSDQNKESNPAGYLAMIYLPLGIHIPAGVTATIDTTSKFKAELLDCDAKVGCRAAFIPTVKTIRDFAAGTTLNVTVMDARSRQLIHFPYPLNGLSAQLKIFNR